MGSKLSISRGGIITGGSGWIKTVDMSGIITGGSGGIRTVN